MHLVLIVRWQALKPASVLGSRHASGGVLELRIGKELGVVGTPVDQLRQETITVSWQRSRIANVVPAACIACSSRSTEAGVSNPTALPMREAFAL